mgnify:CR=1 FL=1
MWANGGRRGRSVWPSPSDFGVLNAAAPLRPAARSLAWPATVDSSRALSDGFTRGFKTPAAANSLVGRHGFGLAPRRAGQGASTEILNGAVFIDTVFFILTGLAVFVLRR